MTATDLTMFNQELSAGSLSQYIHWTQNIPMLTREQEESLAERLKYKHDLEAARELIMSHLRFVVRVARGYSGYGLPQADLIQEGNIGLMKAVKRFDPSLGVRLISFALHWVKAEIHEYVIRNWRIVKIATTKAQRKLFFNLRRKMKSSVSFTPDEVSSIAVELNVPEKDVRLMEKRLKSADHSLNIQEDDTDGAGDYHNHLSSLYLEDHSYNPEVLCEKQNWEQNMTEQLSSALSGLDDRSRYIIESRWIESPKKTLHSLAEALDISAERVRQLENAAMKKLRLLIDAPI